MTTETFASLINLGAAGAVIVVVILFLKYLEKAENSWRNFFTALNKANCDDVANILSNQKEITKILATITSMIKDHDAKVDDHIKAVAETAIPSPRKTT